MTPSFVVPAQYFYALGATLPATVSIDTRFRIATVTDANQLRNSFQDAITRGTILDTPAPTGGGAGVGLEQAIRRLTALGSTTGPGCKVTSGSNVETLVTGWLAVTVPDINTFWATVPGNATLASAHLRLVICVITDEPAPDAFITALQAALPAKTGSITGFVTITRDEWSQFFHDNPSLLPDNTNPGSLDERINAFIRHLQNFFDLALPGTSVVAPTPEGPPLFAAGAEGPCDPLQQFLTHYQANAGTAFVFGTTPTTANANFDASLFDTFPDNPHAQAWLGQAVSAISELWGLVSATAAIAADLRFASVEALYARGFTSKSAIAALSLDAFRDALIGTIIFPDASAIYTAAGGTGGGTSGSTTPTPVNPDGLLVNCVPPDFLSPIGPVAYLANLLKVTDESTCADPTPTPGSEGPTSLSTLVADRRGPLGTLAATRANLETQLPTIDMVNECLESMAAAAPGSVHGAVYDTASSTLAGHTLENPDVPPATDPSIPHPILHEPAKLFAAIPEHSSPATPVGSPAAYDKLRADFSAPILPYAQGLDISRRYLKRLCTSRFAVMRRFREKITEFVLDPTTDPPNFRSNLWRFPVRSDIAREYLEVNPEEADTLFGHDLTDQQLAVMYGFTGSEFSFFDALVISTFLRATGLSYCELVELQRSGFVPFGVSFDDTSQYALPECEPCCLDQYALSLPAEDPVPGLRRLTVFIRLWRKLQQVPCAKYSFTELADICEVLGLFKPDGTINQDFLRQLAAFQMLRDQFGLVLRDPTDQVTGGNGAERTHLLALWVGPSARKWEWAVGHLIRRIARHVMSRHHGCRHNPELLKLLEQNLDPLSVLAGFDPTSTTDSWHAVPTHTLRFAEVLSKILASNFGVGEILFLFTAGDHLEGDDPFPLPAANESLDSPFELPDDEAEHSLARLRHKLLAVHVSEEAAERWTWQRIVHAMHRDFGYDRAGFPADALTVLAEHFFPEVLHRFEHHVPLEKRRYATALAATSTSASMWNTPPFGPFQYDTFNQQLWTMLPLEDEAVLEKLSRLRPLNDDEQHAVRTLYFMPRAALAAFAFIFPNILEAEKCLIQEVHEEKRWRYFRHAFALCHARSRIIASHLMKHVAGIPDEPGNPSCDKNGGHRGHEHDTRRVDEHHDGHEHDDRSVCKEPSRHERHALGVDREPVRHEHDERCVGRETDRHEHDNRCLESEPDRDKHEIGQPREHHPDHNCGYPETDAHDHAQRRDALAWLLLRHLLADENHLSTVAAPWESETGQPPAVPWTPPPNGGAFAALLGLVGTGLLGKLHQIENPDSDPNAVDMVEVRGPASAFGHARNERNAPAPTIIPALDTTLTDQELRHVGVRNGFALRNHDGDPLGGAAGFSVVWQGVLLIETGGPHTFFAGAPTPEGERPCDELAPHQRWRVTLKRGQRTWTVLAHQWPGELAPATSAAPLQLAAGAYDLTVEFTQCPPRFLSPEHIQRQETGFQLKYAGPDTCDRIVTLPASRLFLKEKDESFADLLAETAAVEPRVYLQALFRSSIRDIRRTYQRAFKALLFAERFRLSAERVSDDFQSELGYMLAHAADFAGISFFRPSPGAPFASHLANFDFNFLPVGDNYDPPTLSQDQRVQPSIRRQQAMFDWWERIFDYVALRADACRGKDRRPVWLLFHEAAENHPDNPIQLLRYLHVNLADAEQPAELVLRYYQEVVLTAANLVDERWPIRIAHAEAWLQDLRREFTPKDMRTARPDLWASNDPGLVESAQGESQSGNQILTRFVQDGFIETSAPRRYEDLKELNDCLRERARAALIAYLLAQGRVTLPSGDTATLPQHLSDLLLLDVRAGICERASRIEEGASAVQTFVQRARLGLEPSLVVSPDLLLLWTRRFETFAIWQACVRKEVYKENWITWTELHTARRSEGFRYLEDQLRRLSLTVPVPAGLDNWPSTADAAHPALPYPELFLAQAREPATLHSLDPTVEEGFGVLGTRERHARPSWLAAVPACSDGGGEGSPESPASPKAISAVLPYGAKLPLWIEAAVRLGVPFVRVAAAGEPLASQTYEPVSDSSANRCCRECGRIHPPVPDEYYFWLMDSAQFDPVVQDANVQATNESVPSGETGSSSESAWHNPSDLPKLLDWKPEPSVHLYWSRLHNGELKQVRRSDEALELAATATTRTLVFLGRFGDSLKFAVSEGVRPDGFDGADSPGFRYDLPTDSAQLLPLVTDPIGAPVFLGQLPSYPYFAFFKPGAAIVPPSFFAQAVSVARTLRCHCQFEAALKWYSRVFDPLHEDASWSGPPAEGQSEGGCCVFCDSPPDDQARTRAITLEVLDTLTEWGDAILRRNTPEAFEQARTVFDAANTILGPRPRTDVTADFQGYPSTVSNFGASNSPLNPRLLALYDRVAERRSLVHACLNAERLPIGKVDRDLPYFGADCRTGCDVTPENGCTERGCQSHPDTCLDDADACLIPCPYRFTFQIQKAIELANEVRSLGTSLLTAYEKGDAEFLSSLRATQEHQLRSLELLVRQNEWRDADWQVQALRLGKEIAETNNRYFQTLINNGLNGGEQDYQSLIPASTAARTAGNVVEGVAELLHLIPDVFVGTLSFTQLPVGSKLAAVFSAIARIANVVAEVLSSTGGLRLTQAGWDRREEEWRHQVEVTSIEIDQIERQILGAERRRDASLRQLNNQEVQIQQTDEIDAFLRDKFTAHELYLFLQKETAALYYRMYELALRAARHAERAFNFELGHARRRFITGETWDNLHEGMLAGERLYLAVKQMEKAYIDENVREYELTKHVSLRLLFPLAFLRLKETGSCEIELPEWLFDLDYPGHYLRRIKNVTLTIPSVVGPFTGVHCRLTLLSSVTRCSPSLRCPVTECCPPPIVHHAPQICDCHCHRDTKDRAAEHVEAGMTCDRDCPSACDRSHACPGDHLGCHRDLGCDEDRLGCGHACRPCEQCEPRDARVAACHECRHLHEEFAEDGCRFQDGQAECDERSSRRRVCACQNNGYRVLPNDPRIARLYPAAAAVATSSGVNDSGMFELNFRDERYLPFEFAGAVSRWRIELPHENNFFDPETLTDLVLHLNYTAREGGDVLRKAASEMARCHLPDAGLRLFDLRHDFPDEWSRFRARPLPTQKSVRRFEVRLDRDDFAFLPGTNELRICRLDLLFELEHPHRMEGGEKRCDFHEVEERQGGDPVGRRHGHREEPRDQCACSAPSDLQRHRSGKTSMAMEDDEHEPMQSGEHERMARDKHAPVECDEEMEREEPERFERDGRGCRDRKAHERRERERRETRRARIFSDLINERRAVCEKEGRGKHECREAMLERCLIPAHHELKLRIVRPHENDHEHGDHCGCNLHLVRCVASDDWPSLFHGGVRVDLGPLDDEEKLLAIIEVPEVLGRFERAFLVCGYTRCRRIKPVHCG